MSEDRKKRTICPLNKLWFCKYSCEWFDQQAEGCIIHVALDALAVLALHAIPLLDSEPLDK